MNKIIETPLGKIEYSQIGRGLPVIFVHGGHANCNETIFQQGYDLEKYQLITPSRPGYGNTPVNGCNQPTDAARLIEAMIDQLKLEQVIVVGISAGGLTAIELASRLQHKAQKLILISAVTKKWLASSDKLYKKGKKMFSPRMENLSWAMFRMFFRLFPKRMSKVLFDELSTQSDYAISDEEIEEIKEMTFNQSSGKGFVLDLDHDIDPATITNVKCPTLILHSKNDKSVSIEMAKHAKAKIKGSELKMFDNNWGHLLWVGRDKIKPISALNEFLDGGMGLGKVN